MQDISSPFYGSLSAFIWILWYAPSEIGNFLCFSRRTQLPLGFSFLSAIWYSWVEILKRGMYFPFFLCPPPLFSLKRKRQSLRIARIFSSSFFPGEYDVSFSFPHLVGSEEVASFFPLLLCRRRLLSKKFRASKFGLLLNETASLFYVSHCRFA